MTTEELRRYFHVGGLFQAGELRLQWWEVDRTVIGGVVPAEAAIALPNPAELRAQFFCERREVGVVNLGGNGSVLVDGVEFVLERFDALYIGRGAREVSFRSADASKAAKFYLLSYPAHAAYPTAKVAFKEAEPLVLGSKETSNERHLCKLIHAGRFPTCQLVMGVTMLQKGSVWNSMPPHTHLRRSEVYLYFDVAPEHAVFHFMGEPTETRHIVMRDGEAVLSPPWSLHCGCGTANYGFVWGMGGENQEFTDMDPAPVAKLL